MLCRNILNSITKKRILGPKDLIYLSDILRHYVNCKITMHILYIIQCMYVHKLSRYIHSACVSLSVIPTSILKRAWSTYLIKKSRNILFHLLNQRYGQRSTATHSITYTTNDGYIIIIAISKKKFARALCDARYRMFYSFIAYTQFVELSLPDDFESTCT